MTVKGRDHTPCAVVARSEYTPDLSASTSARSERRRGAEAIVEDGDLAAEGVHEDDRVQGRVRAW